MFSTNFPRSTVRSFTSTKIDSNDSAKVLLASAMLNIVAPFLEHIARNGVFSSTRPRMYNIDMVAGTSHDPSDMRVNVGKAPGKRLTIIASAPKTKSLR